MAEPALSLEGVTKRYGETLAVAPLDLAVAPGEVLALIGENGAGKSTVVNMVSGLTAPDAGTIRIGGRAVTLDGPRQAQAHGIGVVQQHYALVPSFTVAETLALGGVWGRVPRAGMARRVRALEGEVGLAIDPSARIGSLDVAGQQRVEILKALSREVRLLLLDEPAAVLTPEDAERLFAMIRRLKAQGVAVILVTHRLSDVFAVCDRVAVLHAGRKVAEMRVDQATREGLVSLMITGKLGRGRVEAVASADLGAVAASGHEADAGAPVRLSAHDLTLRRANRSLAVAGLSFDLHAGEILAIAGVDGNGQAELVRCLAGLEPAAGGHVRMGALDSRQPARWTPRALRRAGLAHIPEDRRRHAMMPDLPLSETMLLGRFFLKGYGRAGLLDRRRARAETRTAIEAWGIRTTGAAQAAGRLSGGNQQKLVIARELMDDPAVILAAHPSRGLDIRTIALVQETLRRHRDRGAAILLVSADLGEIWGLADRLVVLAAGRARGPVALPDTSREEVGGWMAGH